MGRLARSGLCVVALVALLSMWLYSPIPPSFSKPWRLQAKLVPSKIYMKVVDLLAFVGVEDPFEMLNDFLREHYTHTPPDNIQITDEVYDGVRVRVYTPRDFQHGPALFFIHGGGWVLAFPGLYDVLVERLVHTQSMVVVSVDYRMAPRYPFPEPLNDCMAAYKHFVSVADDMNVDTERIAVGGDSAGGNLAAALSLRLRDEQYPVQPRAQALIYPALQAINLQTPSFVANQHGPLLTRDTMAIFWSMYLDGSKKHLPSMLNNSHVDPEVRKTYDETYMSLDRLPKNVLKLGAPHEVKEVSGDPSVWAEVRETMLDPYFAPLLAKDLGGLPVTHVTTCQYDVLRDDGLWYASRLRDFGIEVDLRHYIQCYHGMAPHFSVFEEALGMVEGVEKFLAAQLRDN